jgi:hypothetical protein
MRGYTTSPFFRSHRLLLRANIQAEVKVVYNFASETIYKRERMKGGFEVSNGVQ